MVLDRLLDNYSELQEVEKEVLLIFSDRLLMGQRAYGKLTERKKDWANEAFEEAVDQAVYSCCGLYREKKLTENIMSAVEEIIREQEKLQPCG